jgi:hypothetical protein
MTAAERMRRYRALKRSGGRPKPRNKDEALALMPMRRFARYLHRSERHCYHIAAFKRDSLIHWDDDILNGEYGRVGFAFLAEVCRYGDAATQRAVRNRIKRSGAAAGRALWHQLWKNQHWELVHRHAERHNRQIFQRLEE